MDGNLDTGLAVGAGGDKLRDVEDLFGSSFTDKLTGGEGGNVLFGGGAGDKLFGLAGADKLSGGAGNDSLNGPAETPVFRSRYGGPNRLRVTDIVGKLNL